MKSYRWFFLVSMIVAIPLTSIGVSDAFANIPPEDNSPEAVANRAKDAALIAAERVNDSLQMYSYAIDMLEMASDEGVANGFAALPIAGLRAELLAFSGNAKLVTGTFYVPAIALYDLEDYLMATQGFNFAKDEWDLIGAALDAATVQATADLVNYLVLYYEFLNQ